MTTSPTICRMGRHDVVIASCSGDSATLAFVAQPLEIRGVVEAQPDVEADDSQHARDQERDAPAVGVHRALGEQGLQAGDGQGAQQETDDHRPHQEGDDEAAVLVGCILGQKARAAAVFAAGRKALQAPQQQQQQRGDNADRVVAGQQTDRSVDARHQQDHQRQDTVPADAIAEGPEQEAAERSHEERRREDRERVEQCRGVVTRWEEVGRDEGGQEAVDREVEPLDGVTDRGAAHRFPDDSGPTWRRSGASWMVMAPPPDSRSRCGVDR